MTRFEVQDKTRFEKRFYNQCPSNIIKFNKSKGSKPMHQEGKGSGPYVEKPICAKCGKCKCLVSTGNCYGCGKSGNMKIDCPLMKAEERENAQAQASAPNPDAPKKNHI